MSSGCITVSARVRPLSSQERARGEVSVISVEGASALTIWRSAVYVVPVSPPPSPHTGRPPSPWASESRSSSKGSRPGSVKSSSRTSNGPSPQVSPAARNAKPSSIWATSPPRSRAQPCSTHRDRDRERSRSVEKCSSRFKFAFDSVFQTMPGTNLSTSQAMVYEQTGKLVLKSALLGISGCLFAYGQTGSGKTFSMLGAADAPGVLPRLADDLFDQKREIQDSMLLNDGSPSTQSANEALQVWVAFLELYNERLVDLLSGQGHGAGTNLKLFEHSREGVTVPGLQETEVHSRAEFGKLMDIASRSRAAGSTRMNKHSSRSHAIVQIRLCRTAGDNITRAKIYAIDLAGSERPRSGFNGSTPNKEGININVSLSTLGLVISRLSEIAQGRGRCSVPFRDSKLTFLLKDSLSGNARTQILITLSPAASSFEESMSTLRFAHSAKRISTRAVADVVKGAIDKKDARDLQFEVECLRAELAQLREACRCASLSASAGAAGTGDTINTCVGELLTGNSCASFSGHQVGDVTRAADIGVRQLTGEHVVEVTSDGLLRPAEGDLNSLIGVLRSAGYVVEEKEIRSCAASIFANTRAVLSAQGHGSEVRLFEDSDKDSQFSCHNASSPNGLACDSRVAEALGELQKTASRECSALAKVNLAVAQIAPYLEPQTALEFIESLTSLCFQLDEANQLLNSSVGATFANRISRLEASWLSPGPNKEMSARDLLRVKVIGSQGFDPSHTELWSLAHFETQLAAMRDRVDMEGPRHATIHMGGVSRFCEADSRNLGDRSPRDVKLHVGASSRYHAANSHSPNDIMFTTSEPPVLSPTRVRGRKAQRSRTNSGDAQDSTQSAFPWSGDSTPRDRKRGLPSTPEDRKRAILEPPEGWQVSLCERVAICYPSALPTKQTFPQRKVPRPVSPDSGMVDELMLSQPRDETKETRRRLSSDPGVALYSQSHSGSVTPNLAPKSSASTPRTPRRHTKEVESSLSQTLAAARAALAAFAPKVQRPQSADPRLEVRERPSRSLTPSAASRPARSRRGTSVRSRMGHSVGFGDPCVVGGAFDRNSLRLRNGRIFVEALSEWRMANSHMPSTPARQLLPGTCAIYVRSRPMFQHEIERCDFDVLSVISATAVSGLESGHEIVHHACMFDKSAVTPYICHTRFPFDGVFSANSTNQEVYCTVARPLVDNALQGNLSTLFIFGQTGTGKTHTMHAIGQLAAEELFERLTHTVRLAPAQVTLSYFELAGRKALDLLNDRKNEIRLREEEDGRFRPHDCEELLANSAEDLLGKLQEASERRATDATAAHSSSSRSHSVCRITIQQKDCSVGQLLLVDCAGLERARDTLLFRGQHQRESADINSSLFALKDCIRCRQAAINKHGGLPPDGSLRLPSVRATPLTKVLAESLLSPSTKLAAIATVSPKATDTEYTLDTLRNIYTLGGRGEGSILEARQFIE